MKNIVLLQFLVFTLALFSQNSDEQYQRVKIHFESPQDISTLNSLGVPTDHPYEWSNTFLITDLMEGTIAKVKNANFEIDILVADNSEEISQNIDSKTRQAIESPCLDVIDYPTPENFSLGSIGGQLSYSELLSELDRMYLLYPNLITQQSNIGAFLTEGEPDDSVSPSIGGNGIKWVKISDNPNDTNEGEPQILYTALHHGREAITLTQLVYYMWYVLDNYEQDPLIKSILDNTELYFVPVVNPDGYLFNEKIAPDGGGTWRKNRKNNGDGSYGVDINRNYNYFIDGNPLNGTWGGEGTSSDPSEDNYHGTGPFSEIESQAIKYFAETHNFTLAINHHATGRNLLYPFGYSADATASEEDVFQTIGASLTSQNKFTVSRLFYANSGVAGDADDFLYGTVNTHDKVYSMTTELNSNSMYPPIDELEKESEEVVHFNLTAAQMVNEKATIIDESPYYLGNNLAQTTNIHLQRIGLNGDGIFTVSLNPVSTNIENIGQPIQLEDLELLDEIDVSMEFTLSPSIENGDLIAYELVLENGIYSERILIERHYGETETILFDTCEDFEENFINEGFGVSITNAFSAPSSFTDSPDGLYGPYETKTLTLNKTLDLTNAKGANVSYYCKWSLERYFDYAQFQVSEDNGETWIAQCGLLTNIDETNALEFLPKYDGQQLEWKQENIVLDDYLGETLQLRFFFKTNSMTSEDGFYVDDFKIETIDAILSNFDENREDNFVLHPNPIKDVLNITTSLSNYSIEVYNLQGQLVDSETNNNGTSSFDYSNFASGLYILQLTSEGTSESFKIIKQ